MGLDDELAASVGVPFEAARMLPVEAYRSPEMLAHELDELFGRDWLCVARTADVTDVGDRLTVELPTTTGKRSIVVVRGDDRTIRAFDNVCLHRGARLVDGCGSAARLICPYHAWSYRLDGSLIGGPGMQGDVEADGSPFRPDGRRLGSLPVETWEGFVFVSFADDPPPLAPLVAGLTEVVARYEMERFVPVRRSVEIWNTNWKLLVENFVDAYHVPYVHAPSFGAAAPKRGETTVFPGEGQWTHHRVVEHDELAAAANTALAGEWRRTIVLAAVFPAFVFQVQPDWLWCLRIWPLGTDRVRIESQVAVDPDVLAEQADIDAYVTELLDLIDLVNSEDRPVVEGIRRSVDGPQFERAPLSPMERNVYDADQYVVTRLVRP